ncbi:MAG: CHRD domain-containing protein [Planctomycetota bacterium]|nr:MAG: CHRD domain-containing protein [Planctomycetota bacterium]
MKTSPWNRIFAFLALAIVIPACHDGDNGDGGVPPPPTGGGTSSTFKAVKLSGRQEVPPVLSSATGSATLVVDETQTSIQVTVTFSGFTGTLTAAHIHVGLIGEDGPIIFPLVSGSFSSPLEVTLTESAFTPQPTAGITSFSQAISAIQEGRTYVNLHTAEFEDGEIRGQVGPVTLTAELNGLQEVPPVLTAGTGSLTVFMNNDQSAMTFTLDFSNLNNINGAHIHVGPVGADGPIIFPIADASFASPLTGTLNEAGLTPQPAGNVSTFADAVDAMITGTTYANVHTTVNPDGEIRGQIQGSFVTIPPPPTKTSRR